MECFTALTYDINVVGSFHAIVVVITVFGLAYYSAKTNITEQEVEGNSNNKYTEQKPQDKPHMKDSKHPVIRNMFLFHGGDK